MAMAPTYFDWLLGKAGTGDRAYAMLEQIGALSSSGKRQRQRVIDIIDAGMRAPWVGPMFPGSTNQHPDANILDNLSRSGFLHGGAELSGRPFGLHTLLCPVLRSGETILESELSESGAGDMHRFHSIVATSLRILTLTNQLDGTARWVDPVTNISVDWLDWQSISSVIVQTAKEAPPCGRITVLARKADAASPTPSPEASNSASMAPCPRDTHSNTLHYYPSVAEELPSPDPPLYMDGMLLALAVPQVGESPAPTDPSPVPPDSDRSPYGTLPEGVERVQPYGPPPADVEPVPPPMPVLGRWGDYRTDAQVEFGLLQIGHRIEQLLVAKRESRDGSESNGPRFAADPDDITQPVYVAACPHCSRQLPTGALFCGHCGQRLDQVGGMSGIASQAATESALQAERSNVADPEAMITVSSVDTLNVGCQRCTLEEEIGRCTNAMMAPPQEAFDRLATISHTSTCPQQNRPALLGDVDSEPSDRAIVWRVFELVLLMARHESGIWPPASGEVRQFQMHSAVVELHYRAPSLRLDTPDDDTYLTYTGRWGDWVGDVDDGGQLVHISYVARGAAAEQ